MSSIQSRGMDLIMAAYTVISTPPSKAASPLHRITLDNTTTSSRSIGNSTSDEFRTSEASTRRLTQSGNRGPCRSCTLRRELPVLECHHARRAEVNIYVALVVPPAGAFLV
jgi:hypothetical protein